MEKKQSRYRIDTFHARSIEQNPLGDIPEKKVKIYLPPDYFEEISEEKRYPTIYLLHGYGGSIDSPMIASNDEVKENYPTYLRFFLRKFFKTLLTFEKIDKLIRTNQIPPFILVQPDGSLPIPHIYGNKGFNGKVSLKGSLYLNSPYTGNYNDYIFSDVIEYIDKTYRTIPKQESRSLIGGSMGGYGAFIGVLFHPTTFISLFALSPAVSWLKLVDVDNIKPLYSKIYGKKKSKRIGQRDVQDILDTVDLVLTKENPLVPSIHTNANGKSSITNEEAIQIWKNYDLTRLIIKHKDSLHDTKIRFNCERHDEFELAPQVMKVHETLEMLEIPHEYEIYDHRLAKRISPHTLGIGSRFLEAIQFALKNMSYFEQEK